MKIAFFVNDLASEYPNYATTFLAWQARQRGHDVLYVTPNDFLLNADDSLTVHARCVPGGKSKDHGAFFKLLRSKKCSQEMIDVKDIDVLMLRNDPANDAQDKPWAAEAGILWGRECVKRGVLVVNDPDSLSRGTNKLYFQSFPREVRADTIITRHDKDVKAFAKKHKNEIILKPLQGSGGSGVFKLSKDNKTNLNQMIESICRDGYVIAQEYVPAAKKGDIRLFIMNGHPLKVNGKYAALRREQAKDDIRSNIHAGGKAVATEVTDKELRVAEVIRPKLIADGMFLVGIDIVGDKILEVNVFSPGNLVTCSRMAGEDFSVPIIEALERKVAIMSDYAHDFDNAHLAII
ncbi:glutathione synthetase [Sphingomicrobium clamense]|uniref:Glutathione synthetase n=1 Tax=Sphingomicrobium clamense TaxID=2851013 RepID=A0ABS6V497_9SPHN|nr:glutathione synthetase [Sphingomicrobium sp. B8]MBW0144364.1 glutathione synthase [Sphingomicrobium sp. B8]